MARHRGATRDTGAAGRGPVTCWLLSSATALAYCFSASLPKAQRSLLCTPAGRPGLPASSSSSSTRTKPRPPTPSSIAPGASSTHRACQSGGGGGPASRRDSNGSTLSDWCRVKPFDPFALAPYTGGIKKRADRERLYSEPGWRVTDLAQVSSAIVSAKFYICDMH